MSFTPFGKGNPCPVCGIDDGACRQSLEDTNFILCHRHADARKGETFNGYVCVKSSDVSHTASFKPYTGDWTEEAKRDWQTRQLQERQLRQKRQQAEHKARQAKALPASERHKLYSQILEQLTLDAATVTDLRRRGFSNDEITCSGFKSAKKWQKLQGNFPQNLPGIGKNGNSLLTPGDGYLCPVRNVDGLIVGLQLRLHEPIDGNRYRWLSSADSPVKTKEFDELPLAVYIPSQIKSFNIQLTEGTGVKPYLAAERMGMITVGAAGGNHASSPKTLENTISTIQEAVCQIAADNGLTLTNPSPEIRLRKSKELLSANGEKSKLDAQSAQISQSSGCPSDTQDNYLISQLRNSLPNIQNLTNTTSYQSIEITISPDAGFALNKNVIRTLLKTTNWLQENVKDIPIYFHDWNQIHKSQGDIDELNDLTTIRRLSFESFTQKKYKEVFNLDQGFANKRYQDWANSRVNLTADIIQHEKWLTIPEGIQNTCDILLIRKALGGGKTQALIEFLKSLDTVSLLVGYRNSLLNNTISRANTMGLNAQHIRDTAEVLDGHYINFAEDESIKLWAGCADSFFKFDAIISRNPSYCFIHDEICSVLGHLKGGGTLKGRQKQAIEWDTEAIKNSQFAIMMDANLSDNDVNFIRQLFPDKRIKVIDSIYPNSPRDFYFIETANEDKDYTTNPKFLPSQLLEKAKSANKVLWISDSQRSCEIADEILTRQGHKHFRLDGKTSHDELSKQLQSDPKLFITTEKLDSLSISPSGESGLSIDFYDYFDAVCFDIRGTVSVNTLTQLSARLRDTKVPIYVACPEFVNMTSDPCPYAIKSVGEVINQRIEMLLAKAMEVDGELVNSQFVASMFTDMGQKFASDPWFIESLKDAKQLKYEHQNLKLTLKTALAQAGHRIIDLVETADEGQHEETKEAKETVKRREAQKVFNSENIDWEKAQELAKKDVNYDDKCKIRKARLKHKLPGIEDTESWSADFIYAVEIDQPQFIDKRWRLMQLQNNELFKAVFKFEKKYNFEHGFTGQDIWKSASTKIEALKLLGVGKLIDADVFSVQDEWVRAIVDDYYENPDWFNLIGIPKAKRSNKDSRHVKTMVNRFLDYFGLETKQSGRSETGQRWYTIQAPQTFLSPIPSIYIKTNESVTANNQNKPEDEFNYLAYIDKSLARRAETAISDAQEISLKGTADKAEQAQRQQQEWEERHQAELNKRILESQLTHAHSGVGVAVATYLYKPSETATPTEVNNIANCTHMNQISQMEDIKNIARMLDNCECFEDLSRLRDRVPSDALRQASRQLPPDKREQIRSWVVEDNSRPLEPIEGF